MKFHEAVKEWNKRRGYIKFEGAGARKKQEQHPVKWEANPPESDFIKVGKGEYELKPLAAPAPAVAEERAPVAPASVMAMPETDGEAGRAQVVAEEAARPPPPADDEEEDVELFMYKFQRYYRGTITKRVFEYEPNGDVGREIGRWDAIKGTIVRTDADTDTLAEGDYMPSVLEDDDDMDINRDYKKFVMPNRYMPGEKDKYWITTSGRLWEYQKPYRLGRWVGIWDRGTNKIDYNAPMPLRDESVEDYNARYALLKAREPKLYYDYHINPKGYDTITRIGEPIDRSHYLYFMEPSRALFRRPELSDERFVREAKDYEYIEFLRHLIAKVEKQAEEKRRQAQVAAAVAEVERPRAQLVAAPQPGARSAAAAAAPEVPQTQKARGREIEKMRIQAYAAGDIEPDEFLFITLRLKGKEYWRKEGENLVWEKDGDRLGNWAGVYEPMSNTITMKSEPTLEYDGTPSKEEEELWSKATRSVEAPKPKAELVVAPTVPSAAAMAAGGGGGGSSIYGKNMAARKINVKPTMVGEDETLGIFTFAGKMYTYSTQNEVWEYNGGDMGKWVGKLVNDVMTRAPEPKFSEV